jgi:hypothetical protein
MANTYQDQLGPLVKQKLMRGNINLVAFLAIRDEVKAALETGNSVKTVWADMRECKRIEIGYEVFLHYVNRLIRGPQADQATTSAGPRLSKHPATVEPNTTPDGTTPDGTTPVGTIPTTAKAMKPAAPADLISNRETNEKELF